MLVSAEIRWFWNNCPQDLQAWFCGKEGFAFPVGGGQRARTDVYLRDQRQAELGLKIRGNQNSEAGVEVKGLVAVSPALAPGPFPGNIEIWTKWTSPALTLPSLNASSSGTIQTEKLRWLRKFDTTGAAPDEVELNDDEKPAPGRALPARGCNVELTKVTLASGADWWTFGFEAFGSLSTVEGDLRSVAALLAQGIPDGIAMGILASYPAWLQQHAEPGTV